MPPLSTKQEIVLRQSIGKTIERLMLAKGWNQSRLAAEASKRFRGKGEISRSNVSTWIRGINRPAPLRAEALAKTLGEPVTTFRPVEAMKSLQETALARREYVNMVDFGEGQARVQINRILPWDLAIQIVKLAKDEGGTNGRPHPEAGGGGHPGQPADSETLAGGGANKAVVRPAKRSR